MQHYSNKKEQLAHFLLMKKKYVYFVFVCHFVFYVFCRYLALTFLP